MLVFCTSRTYMNHNLYGQCQFTVISTSFPIDVYPSKPPTNPSFYLYLHLRPMEWIPNSPHTLIDTRHRLAVPLLILLTRAIPQQFRLLPHALVLQVLDAYRPLSAVDVMCDDDGVPPWPWADCDFDLWAVARECGQRGFYEGVHAAG
jgi:hypothetical protein